MFSLVASRQGMGVTGDAPYGCDIGASGYGIVLQSLESMRVGVEDDTSESIATLGKRCKCFVNKELMVTGLDDLGEVFHNSISQTWRGIYSGKPIKNASTMSEEEEEFVKKEDRGGQDPEYEIYGGRGVQMADPERLENQEQSFSSLSRSSTQSFENMEEVSSGSKVEKIFKPQALSSKLESFKDVEGIWFNKDVWVIPPADTDDEVLGSSLVDDEDDDDDDEGMWGQSHPSSVRTSSDYLQSRIKLRVKMESDFLLAVGNLLQEEGIPKGEEGDPNSWLQIVSTLALQAATYVKPNTSKGGGMDPREYVKVKCIASGRCSDSALVKGIVCHKNVQHRRMTSRFRNPRLLLLGGALEYQRSQNQLSSLTGLPQQEIDYLTATVARIDALHPNVLLVEKTVAGIAQETLLSKEVSLVLKVKRPLLDRIARCTGAHVISSVDNFEAAKVGQCEQFRIEKFEEELNPGGGIKKNAKYLMYFEGCPRPLGCTILLQGASTEELKRVKKAVKSTVSYAYHLSLETSFLADEGATLPSNPLQCIPSSKRSSLDSTISTVPGFTPPPSRAPSHGRNSSPPEDGIPHRVSSNSLDTQQFTEFAEEEFPPSTPDHQSIVISLSSRTMSKGNVCEKPQLKRIKYYGPSDKPIGIFLKEFLGNTVNRCPRCEEPYEDHEYRYAHSSGCLTLYSKVLRGVTLPGEKEGKIWMWHRCLRCPRPEAIPPSTRRVPLSDSAQNISFGKLLQLNFSQQAMETITGCGHHVYRDCLRFFGIGNTVACLLYNPIKLLCVSVPPPQLEFNIPSSLAWLKVETQEIVELGVNLFAAATDQLRGLDGRITGLGPLYSTKAVEARVQLAELESLLQKEREDFEEQLQMAAPLESFADILALNKLRRHLALVYNGWDSRVKKLITYLAQVQNTASAFIPTSFSEAVSGTASSPEEPSAGDPSAGEPSTEEPGPLVDAVTPESEGGAGLPENMEGALDELSIEDTPVEETISATNEGLGSTAEKVVEESDTSSHSIPADGEIPHDSGESEPGGAEGFSNKSLSLDRQTSNPLPFSGTSAGEMGTPARSRPLSEGSFPIMVDLPVTLEMAWRGDGSIDASVVEAPVAASGGEDYAEPVSDLTAMAVEQQEGEVGATTTTNRSTLDQQIEAALGVDRSTLEAKEDGLKTALYLRKDNPETSLFGGTYPLQEVGLDVSSRPSSPLKDKEGTVDLEVSRPASPLEEVALVVSRPTSPFKDKEESESGALSASNTFNKGSRSPSRVLQSASSVYTSAYSRSNSTVPKVQQFFLHGVARVRLPSGVNGTVVAVYDEEPTSVIAYALTSREYQNQLIQDPVQENEEGASSNVAEDGTVAADGTVAEEGLRSTTPPLERPATPGGVKGESPIGKALTSPTPLTVKVRFTDYYSDIAKTEFQVLCYYTRQFIALRAKCCGGEMEYIRSLSRCKTWGAQGGKSKAYFAKTLDDRFIVKQVSSTEKYSFLEFAPQYFKHLWETMSSGSPTCLAKILGFYTVTVKKGGKEKEMDMMVMENLVYGKTISRTYDLKGSLRSRYNPDATGTLLDQNLLEDMPTSPIFMTNKAKLMLERAVYNDTSFLAKVHVMDYSLLAVVLEDRQELVIGIIDYIRQYTWDKHLETWVKASGILGGSKNTTPTVVSPKEYKKRFRKAISSYFVVVPESEAPPLLHVTTGNQASVSPLPPSDSSSSLLLSDDATARDDTDTVS